MLAHIEGCKSRNASKQLNISSILRVTMLIGVIGCGRGLRMQVGAGHRCSTYIALNCNVGTLLGLKESNSIDIGIFQISPGSLC